MACWLAAAVLVLFSSSGLAGTLNKAQVEAMFPPPWLVGEMLGHLPVWPVFTRTGPGPELQNYVFETVDLEPVAGYGGKPVNVMVVMDRDGAFVTSRLLSHMEPIFRSETGTAQLNGFAQQYKGVTVHHQVHVLGAKAQRVVTPTIATLHGVVAGTVSANAIDRSIMESAAQVAQMAQAAGIDLVPHSWLTHLLTGYSLQLIATLPRARFVEFNVSQSALTRGIAASRFALQDDGTVAIPDSVDMGVEVDEDFVAAHRVN